MKIKIIWPFRLDLNKICGDLDLHLLEFYICKSVISPLWTRFYSKQVRALSVSNGGRLRSSVSCSVQRCHKNGTGCFILFLFWTSQTRMSKLNDCRLRFYTYWIFSGKSLPNSSKLKTSFSPGRLRDLSSDDLLCHPAFHWAIKVSKSRQ